MLHGLFLWFGCGLQKNIIFSVINKQITSVTCYWSPQDPVHELKMQDRAKSRKWRWGGGANQRFQNVGGLKLWLL